MIRVDLAGNRADDLVVIDDEFEMKPLLEVERLENPLVPVARPSLVHDLRLHHRDEVLGFLIDDGEQIFFEVGEERIVIADEEQDVFVGFERDLVEVGNLDDLARVDFLKRIGRALRGVFGARHLLVRRELLDREIAPALP